MVEHHGSRWLCCYIHYMVRLYSGPYQDWVLCERYHGLKLVRPAGYGRYWHGSLSYSFTDFQGLVIKYKKASTSLVAQLAKNLPAMQEVPVQFLGWEDPQRNMHSHIHGLPWWLRL